MTARTAAPATNGGLPARRAVVRWAGRSLRREWRQQVVVLGLLVVTVAASTFFTTVVFNTTNVREEAQFGTANHQYVVEQPGAALVPALSVARSQFGAVGVIGRWEVALPGSVETVAYVAQDQHGPFAAPMLDVLDGRFPRAADEAAITDEIAASLRIAIGDTIGLDGAVRSVVGIVENPSDLAREFVLTSATEIDRATSIVLLIGGDGSTADVRAIRDFGSEHLPSAELTSRADVARARAAAGVVGVAQVVLVLVCLVAAAGFAALAQRRLRQLGMLTALGATRRHLALVVVVNGVAIGVVASVAGAAAGLASWFAIAPSLEAPLGYRIDRWNVPWLLVLTTLIATLTTTTIAAWLPARSAARVPPVGALSGRLQPPPPAHRTAGAGIALAAAGVATLLMWGEDSLALAIGTLSTVAGVLLISPVAVHVLGRAARLFPVSARIALRDVARHRSRSAVALAAISLSLGVPAAIVILTGVAEADATRPNLPGHQAILWTKDQSQPDGVSPFYTVDPNDDGFSPYLPSLDQSELGVTAAAIEVAARQLRADVTSLDVVVDPQVRGDPNGTRAVTVARPTDIGYLDVALVYAAVPELGGNDVDAGPALLTTGPPTGPAGMVTDQAPLYFANTADPPEVVDERVRLPATFTSLPGSFLTPSAIAERGWTTTTVGWLLTADHRLTPDELGDLRELAVHDGLVVETAESARDLSTLRWAALAIGGIAALAVLAMTVGLIRLEAARDVRTLTATGASRRVRRGVTAATAGSLVAAGAVLGTAGAYLTVGAGHVRDVSALLPLPLGQLAVIVVVIPLAATVVGWLSANREPGDLGRTPLE